ncbi:MAG: ribulose-phosphate 3-epimerase [Eubacteriales bacterium]|nr:ribulose-phosphate 3-epimerase [Eubacteriales bacterium]
MIELAPSLLAADVLRLGDEIARMLDTGVQTLHFDVMDAHFVPNLSFGPDLCKAIHKAFPGCVLDVHLMMDNPEKYLDVFAKAGAHAITLHQEVLADIPAAMQAIRGLGVRCGLSVKPGTPAETLLPYLPLLDQILIMTVEPGFGGQKFMADQLEKIRMLRAAGFGGVIAVDGGVNPDNAPLLAQAGANLLVMGTAFFKAADPAAVGRQIKELA